MTEQSRQVVIPASGAFMTPEEITELNRSTAETRRLAMRVPRGMCDDVAILHEQRFREIDYCPSCASLLYEAGLRVEVNEMEAQ